MLLVPHIDVKSHSRLNTRISSTSNTCHFHPYCAFLLQGNRLHCSSAYFLWSTAVAVSHFRQSMFSYGWTLLCINLQTVAGTDTWNTLPCAGKWQGRLDWQSHAGVPIAHRRDIQAIFPDVGLEDMLIVPTCQRTDVDLVNFGDHVEKEKDLRLERFMAWSKAVCKALSSEGHWCDYIDPCSGLPVSFCSPYLPFMEFFFNHYIPLVPLPAARSHICAVN